MDAPDLKQVCEQLQTKLTQALDSNRLLTLSNALLSERIRLLLIKKYGASAERLSDGQLALLELEPSVCAAEVQAEAAVAEEEKAVVAQPARKRPVRGPLPADLPREEIIVRCPEDQCHCGQCGELKKLIGYESSERLSRKPVQYFVEVTKREKLACAKCEEMGVSVAPVPPTIIEKGILSDTLVVDVVIKKYCEHLPFYRQAAGIMRDADIPVSQSTLGGSTLTVGELLKPISELMKEDLLAGGYIQADETTVPVQSKRAKGKNHQAYFWEYGRPDGPVVYEFRMGREREGPKIWLGDYNGKFQCDGYGAYDHIGGVEMELFGCWAHGRRKFFDASKLDPKDAVSVAIIARIGKLYDVEREAREGNLNAAEREALRGEKSLPLLAQIRSMIVEARAGALPKSALGKACTYAINQWERLIAYAQKGNGRVEIDNNWAENGMRGIALGRKNWIHVGSEQAGPKIAAILSVLETCKRLKINAREYLEDVLPKLAFMSTRPQARTHSLSDLTPMAWQRARTGAPK